METSQIKKFAQQARTILKQGIQNKISSLGFDASGHVPADKMPIKGQDHVVFMGQVIEDVPFYDKWQSLHTHVTEKGIAQVCEEAAYTWFNRLVAIRILMKNNLIEPVLAYPNPSLHIPRIVADARRGIYPQMTAYDRKQLDQLLDDDTKTTEQFGLLIVNYCRNNPVLAACFGDINDYTELLLPINILAANGFVDLLNNTTFITDEDYKQSELIGWLYQFYISEKKDKVFASKQKRKPEDIPAATQIFTPNWIVKYMVQNTLGRIYLDNNPNAQNIKSQMKYLVEPATPSPEGLIFRYTDVHQLTIADLACGSGHILNEAFDLLLSIYIEEGYNRRQAIKEIFEYNLLGIDLDTRAKQLAMFALLLKACQKDKSFLDAQTLPHVLDMHVADLVIELNAKDNLPTILNEFFAGANETTLKETIAALKLLEQGKNLGSIMRFELSDSTRTAIVMRYQEWKGKIVSREMGTLLSAFEVILALTDKYAALVMNPPYMGSGDMNANLISYVNKNYPAGKGDLATVFIEMMPNHLEHDGKYSFIVPPSWMFLNGFESLRVHIIKRQTIDSLLHLSRGVFGADFGSSSVVITNGTSEKLSTGTYFRLIKRTFQEFAQEHLKLLFEKTLSKHNFKYFFEDYDKSVSDISYNENGQQIYYPNVNQRNFEKIPGCPIGYWLTSTSIFDERNIEQNGFISGGRNKTHDNDRYVRFFWEISKNSDRWHKYANAGGIRKYYAIEWYVVDWSEQAREFYNSHGGLLNSKFWGKKGITWNLISSSIAGFSIKSEELIHSSGSPTIFNADFSYDYYTLGFLNSQVARFLLKLFNPTINTTGGDVLALPLIKEMTNEVTSLVENNVEISKGDWDAHETSWDFQENELLRLSKEHSSDSLEKLTEEYQKYWADKFLTLHKNEEELNRQFIGIYGLQDELIPDVPLDEVTILQQGEISIENNELKWNKDEIVKQLISYAVGCMMGRYRLDKPGLHIAHPNPTDEEISTYSYNGQSFGIDKDAILPLMTRDSAFSDNATECFKHFLKVAFGAENLTENLNFIESVLGKDIETYFVKDLWKDHLKRYQNRPIYWLFRSDKGAFQCLVYMHRMNPYTAEQVRTRYLLPHIEYLTTRLAELESRAAELNSRERRLKTKFEKDLVECQEYHDRLHQVADRQIAFDLDDGVVVNYAKFEDVLAKIKKAEKK